MFSSNTKVTAVQYVDKGSASDVFCVYYCLKYTSISKFLKGGLLIAALCEIAIGALGLVGTALVSLVTSKFFIMIHKL